MVPECKIKLSDNFIRDEIKIASEYNHYSRDCFTNLTIQHNAINYISKTQNIIGIAITLKQNEQFVGI